MNGDRFSAEASIPTVGESVQYDGMDVPVTWCPDESVNEEVCPGCDRILKLSPWTAGICPTCGMLVKPCSSCYEDGDDCSDCPWDQIAYGHDVRGRLVSAILLKRLENEP